MVERGFSQLVVGHNMPDAEVDNIFSSENDFEEEACEEVATLIKKWHKDTAGIIAANEGNFSNLGNVTDVYVLGHLMNDVDLPYFEKIKQNLPQSAKWHISVFSEIDINNKQQAVNKLRLVNVDFIGMESMSLNREGELF